jgi:hypothetical protein
VLELPAFLPDRYLGSVYLGYVPQAPRERPGGYSTVAPPSAVVTMRELRSFNCGGGDGRLLGRLGVRYVIFDRPLYRADRIPSGCTVRARRRLTSLRFVRLVRDGGLTLYGRSG